MNDYKDLTLEEYQRQVKMIFTPEPEHHQHTEDGDIAGDSQFWVHTIGMARFGRPELELRNVPVLWVEAAGAELNYWAFYSITQKPIEAGERMQMGNVLPKLVVANPSPDSHWLGEGRNGCLRLEVVMARSLCHECHHDSN